MPLISVRVKVPRQAAAVRVTVEAIFPANARLCHACDGKPGIVRERIDGGFRYRDSSGHLVRDRAILDRIRVLAIPPAWEEVWICPAINGHIQATGRDARGRKQYRYHPSWTVRRGDQKFSRMAGFGRVLPRIRAAAEADLARSGLPREKVLAAVVKLLDQTHLRVGNAEYAKSNKSFGLSTLLDRHVSFDGGAMRVRFRGKSGVWHERTVGDRALARVVRGCRDLPGQELFQYVDDRGKPRPIGSTDVNAYIRRAAGGEYTAKDFRTWAGTTAAGAFFAETPLPDTKKAAERAVVGVIARVAAELGNTPAICRKSYVHPEVIEAFLGGNLPDVREGAGDRSSAERRVLKLFES